MILVSGCLCGVNCKYSGGNNLNEEIYELYKKGILIPVCPEQLGGLTTPRPPSEIILKDGETRVMAITGEDYTENFIRGAEETLRIAKDLGVKKAILKAKSPSCGIGKIYDGTFSGTLKEGNGITAELLLKNGIKVYTEDNFDYKKLLND